MCKSQVFVAALITVAWAAAVLEAEEKGVWTAHWKNGGVVAGTVKQICSWGLQPMMSPDGLTVAFWGREPDDTTNDVCVANVDGSGIVNLTRDAQNTSNNFEPFWTPDGRILFSSNRSGARRIWVVNRDGSALRQISGGADSSGHARPCIRPDNPITSSTPVVFAKEENRQAWLHWVTFGSDAGTPKRVDTGGIQGSRPVFSPDGTKLAFRCVDGPHSGEIPVQAWNPERRLSLQFLNASGLNMRGGFWKKEDTQLFSVHWRRPRGDGGIEGRDLPAM